MSVQMEEKRAYVNTHNHCMTRHCHIHYVHVKLGAWSYNTISITESLINLSVVCWSWRLWEESVLGHSVTSVDYSLRLRCSPLNSCCK